MGGGYLIEVAPKTGMVDPLGHEIAQEARHQGVRTIKNVSTSQLYRLSGSLKPDQLRRIGQDLLADPVTQEFHDGAVSAQPRKKCIAVDVWYKPGVTDVIGESVLKGIRDLAVEGIEDVRTGIRYRFWGLKNVKQAETLALSLLVNPLVHDKVVHAD